MKTIKILIALIATGFILFSCTAQDVKKNIVGYNLSKLKLTGKVKTITETTFFAENKTGQIQKGDTLSKTITLFNERGNMINKIEDNASDLNGRVMNLKGTFKYDDKGNMIELKYYESDGRLYEKSTYKYDEKGNIMVWQELYEGDSLFFKHTFKYDKKGDMIEDDIYSPNEILGVRDSFKYDDNGNLIETSYYDGTYGCSRKLNTYKYDEKGNVIEDNSYNPDGSSMFIKRYKYDYDKTGNWIKKTEFVKEGLPESITQREIEYY